MDAQVTPLGAIRFILATPSYNNGVPGLYESDVQEIETWLAKAQAELDAIKAKWQAAMASLEVITSDAIKFLARAEAAEAQLAALQTERDEIVEALDTYGWWMDNTNMLERLKFALSTSQDKADELSTMHLAAQGAWKTEVVEAETPDTARASLKYVTDELGF